MDSLRRLFRILTSCCRKEEGSADDRDFLPQEKYEAICSISPSCPPVNNSFLAESKPRPTPDCAASAERSDGGVDVNCNREADVEVSTSVTFLSAYCCSENEHPFPWTRESTEPPAEPLFTVVCDVWDLGPVRRATSEDLAVVSVTSKDWILPEERADDSAYQRTAYDDTLECVAFWLAVPPGGGEP